MLHNYYYVPRVHAISNSCICGLGLPGIWGNQAWPSCRYFSTSWGISYVGRICWWFPTKLVVRRHPRQGSGVDGGCKRQLFDWDKKSPSSCTSLFLTIQIDPQWNFKRYWFQKIPRKYLSPVWTKAWRQFIRYWWPSELARLLRLC